MMLQLVLFVCVLEGVGGVVGVRLGVGRPCPPVRNDIVTQRHLITLLSTFFIGLEISPHNPCKKVKFKHELS